VRTVEYSGEFVNASGKQWASVEPFTRNNFLNKNLFHPATSKT